jgi:hypothetical protein
VSTEEVTFNLELNVEGALGKLRQIEGLTFRTLGYMQRLGLPENVNQAIGQLQQLAMTVRVLHTAIIAFELATGPIGWWRAGLAIVGAAFSVGGLVSSMSTETSYDNQRGNA